MVSQRRNNLILQQKFRFQESRLRASERKIHPASKTTSWHAIAGAVVFDRAITPVKKARLPAARDAHSGDWLMATSVKSRQIQTRRRDYQSRRGTLGDWVSNASTQKDFMAWLASKATDVRRQALFNVIIGELSGEREYNQSRNKLD